MGKGAKATEAKDRVAGKMPSDFWVRYTDEVSLCECVCVGGWVSE
jgi:hypothetical protein